MEFPQWCELEKGKLKQTNEWFPDSKVMFHVAHGLYVTNRPERFADARAIDFKGKQMMYGPDDFDSYYGRYFSRERFDDNWRWWIFYPTEDNSYGKMMVEATEYMMDELGAEGLWADGLISGYVVDGTGRSPKYYSYDEARWDGHSVDIDPETKLVTRKKNCVPYLAMPILKKMINIISERDGSILLNGHPGPRSFWNMDIITTNETGGGDQRPVGGLHVGRSVVALGNPNILKNERDIYRDILSKLDFGSLYFWYGGRDFVTRKHMTHHMYPITYEAIHPGTVYGKERIITKKSGIYGWKGDKSLHMVYLYDARGEITRHNFVTTVDEDGVRTEIKLEKDQAVAIVKIPVSLKGSGPVNLIARQYSEQGLRISLRSAAKDKLHFVADDGELRVDGTGLYELYNAGRTSIVTDYYNKLIFAVELNGRAEMVLRRVR